MLGFLAMLLVEDMEEFFCLLLPPELAAAAVRGLVSAPAADFADAAKRVLRKNEELYRRLA